MFLSFYIKILKHPSISTLARLRAIHFYILVMRHSRNRAHDRQALKIGTVIQFLSSSGSCLFFGIFWTRFTDTVSLNLAEHACKGWVGCYKCGSCCAPRQMPRVLIQPSTNQDPPPPPPPTPFPFLESMPRHRSKSIQNGFAPPFMTCGTPQWINCLVGEGGRGERRDNTVVVVRGGGHSG